MISKTSLFNAGIYKSTVKRNIWGSIIFFAIIYLFSTMTLISDIKYIDSRYTNGMPYIYQNDFLMPTMFLCMFVPTVVAMLTYRFVHSKKAAIFTHSLPVNRNAIYISTLLGAFTIMAAPIVVNGIIFMFLSFTAYSGYFTIANCIVWMALHIFFLFVMFSFSIFSAMLTGNTISTPIINLVVHIFVLAIAAEMSYLAYEYLFGYTNDQIVLEFIAENHPVTWFIVLAGRMDYDFETAKTLILKESWIYLTFSILMYVFSFLMYKKRMVEKAEDVASFKILNPIYKYLVTFIASFGTYAVYKDIFDAPFISTVMGVIITTSLVYFGCEMILKKTFAVWKSYKGLICYGGVFCVILCVFAFTSFFGFETRVPDINDIEGVSVYHYYYGDSKPYVKDPYVIEHANKLHRNIIDNYRSDSVSGTYNKAINDIHIEYKLKNGNTLLREYSINNDLLWETLNSLYKSDEYVTKNENVFDVINIKGIRISKINEYIANKEKATQLLNCIKQDLLSIDYSQIHIDTSHYYIPFEIEHTIENDDQYYSEYKPRTKYSEVLINGNYKNTINWLKENGYWDRLRVKLDKEICISKVKSYYSANNANVEAIALYSVRDAVSLNKLSEYISTMDIKAGYGDYLLYINNSNGIINPITLINDSQLEEIKQLLDLD